MTDAPTTTETTTAIARRRNPPTLIKIGNRELCSDGHVHPTMLAEYVRVHGRSKWIPVSDLAKVFTGARTREGARRVRRHLYEAFILLLTYDEFLVYEMHGRATGAVKLLDVTSAQERQHVIPQINRMRQRQELSTSKYAQAVDVYARKQAVAEALENGVTA